MDYGVKLPGLAEDDLDGICEYLSQFYPGTVDRFLEAPDRAFVNASHYPRVYQLCVIGFKIM
jgi:hypothetical protein